MSKILKCHLCKEEIITPLDPLFNWCFKRFFGSRYSKEYVRIVKKRLRLETEIDGAVIIDAHDECVEKLFNAGQGTYE